MAVSRGDSLGLYLLLCLHTPQRQRDGDASGSGLLAHDVNPHRPRSHPVDILSPSLGNSYKQLLDPARPPALVCDVHKPKPLCANLSWSCAAREEAEEPPLRARSLACSTSRSRCGRRCSARCSNARGCASQSAREHRPAQWNGETNLALREYVELVDLVCGRSAWLAETTRAETLHG